MRENIIAFLETEKNYYRQFREGDPLGKVKEKLKLNPITDPETELHHTLPYWCCDEKLVDKFGRNGYLLSEIVYRMICEFFKTDPYKLYTINSDDLWLPWNDMMSQDYVFETNTEIYILHLGEST
ncbi:MAG TPA: hypothetical protein VL651_07625 [Bacteroidia bacterium]|nr:hypothetical protein [Bacteroidia bacterium]